MAISWYSVTRIPSGSISFTNGRTVISDGSSLRLDHFRMQQSSFIIITGLSGSGKGTFLRALEDRGFFCVDNLPVSLLNKFYELLEKSESESAKAAIVIDVREGQTLSEFPAVYEQLKKDASLHM